MGLCSSPSMSETAALDDRPVRPPGTNSLLWVLWLTYGSFYFCRTNLAVAVPGIEAEFHLTKTEIGTLLGSLKLAYGIGQLINGQLAERFSPRKLLAIGMLTSAALNIVFGWMTGLYFFLFIWACNGYVQALGWTPTMRVAANWLPAQIRGASIGIIGTGYQATAALTFVVAGYSVEWCDNWRGALWIPSGMLILASIHMLLFLKESPPGGPVQQPRSQPRLPRPGFAHTLVVTLQNPALWFLAIGLGLLNACRYGFLDWGLAHLTEVQDDGIGKNSAKYMFLPLGGFIGALVTGWATDRFFRGRRAPVICGLLVALGLLTLTYHSAVHAGTLATIGVLVLVGFCVFGAQVLLVGTAPVDLARHNTPAAAVGFVNFMGYMGAFSGDQVTGTLVENHGWQVGIWFWAGCAFAAAGCVAFLWRVSPTRRHDPT